MTTRRLTYTAAALALFAAAPAFAQTTGAAPSGASAAGASAQAGAAGAQTSGAAAGGQMAPGAQGGASMQGSSSGSAASSSFHQVTAGADIVATLRSSGQFNQFVSAVQAANLTSVLQKPGVTVFAPTDAAFAAATPSQKAALAATDHGQRLLAYHIINTKVEPAQLNGAFGPVPSAIGPNVYLDGTKQPFKANAANVLQAGLVTGNGSVIWVVDQVLDQSFVPPPPTPVAAPAAPAASTPGKP
jgi:uncharacterized surface protein with fasciclin (FAS1) repeats